MSYYYYKIGNYGGKKILDALQTIRHGLKQLQIHLNAPAGLETAVSLFKVLVAQQSLTTLVLKQSHKSRGESRESFEDFACYAVAKSLVFKTALYCLSIQSSWVRISHEASLYEILDDELNAYLSSKRARMEVTQSLMAGMKDAKASLAWLLLSSLNQCQAFEVFNINPIYFLHDDDAYQIFLEILPKNCYIRILLLSKGKEEENWYHDDRCREKVEKLVLQCVLDCPRILLTSTGIPDDVADTNGYRNMIDHLYCFNLYDRSVIEKSSSKKEAVEILVKHRNNLCCLQKALLMNPAIFFFM